MWAFSQNGAAGIDRTATIYPSVAWWDGTYALPQSDAMFARWASPEFSTGWGTRDVGDHEKVYDPISYHQGTVWPLFTGWASLAEYRTGRPAAGYEHLMQNVDLTYAQDLGAVTELLSGKFYAPLGRSTSHQMWSSAMVISPALRGLFGIRVDAEHKTVWVNPQMPAGWTGATMHNLNLEGKMVDVKFFGAKACAKGMCRQGAALTNAPPGWNISTTKSADTAGKSQ
jgi:glycogen debranching enzyme